MKTPKLTNVPVNVYEAHVAPHVSLADAARVAVASRSLRDMAAPGVRARVQRVVHHIDRMHHIDHVHQSNHATPTPVGDGTVRVTIDDTRPSQRIVTTWLVTPTASVPVLVDVRGPGRVRVVRAYDPPPLRSHPLLRRAVRVYASQFSK